MARDKTVDSILSPRRKSTADVDRESHTRRRRNTIEGDELPNLREERKRHRKSEVKEVEKKKPKREKEGEEKKPERKERRETKKLEAIETNGKEGKVKRERKERREKKEGEEKDRESKREKGERRERKDKREKKEVTEEIPKKRKKEKKEVTEESTKKGDEKNEKVEKIETKNGNKEDNNEANEKETKKDENIINEKSNDNEEKKKEISEEEYLALLNQKVTGNTGGRILLPIQRPTEVPKEEEKKNKKGGFFGFGFGKKKKEQAMEIGGVISFCHEGHAGFDSDKGGLQTEGLPPALQDFFNKLNDTMKSLGFDGVTQKEMKMVLRKFGHLIIQETTPAPTTATPEPTLTYDEIVVKLRDNDVQLAGMKATLTTLQQSKAKFQQEVQDLNGIIQDERKNSQNLMKINTNLEIEVAKLREMIGTSGGDEGNQIEHGSSSALQQLEVVMRKSLEEVSEKLSTEQQRNLSLQDQLQTVVDEKDDLIKQIDQLKELLKQNAQDARATHSSSLTNSINNSLNMSLNNSNNSVNNNNTPLPPPPPPPSNLPPPPPPPVNLVTPSNESNGLAGIGSVQLRKTEVEEKKVYIDPKNDLLSAIRGGTTLKHVDVTEQKPKEDEGVLNLIARALIDRRNRIKEGDEDEDSDNGDWDD